MSLRRRQFVAEMLDSAQDNSFNGYYDHDAESQWLASKLNEPMDLHPNEEPDPPMFQQSEKRFSENG